MPLHLNKASDRRRLVEAEDTLPVTEAYSPVHLTPVAVITPLAALAWVTVSGPADELVVEDVVQDLEVVFGDAVLVVVGPALESVSENGRYISPMRSCSLNVSQVVL